MQRLKVDILRNCAKTSINVNMMSVLNPMKEGAGNINCQLTSALRFIICLAQKNAKVNSLNATLACLISVQFLLNVHSGILIIESERTGLKMLPNKRT